MIKNFIGIIIAILIGVFIIGLIMLIFFYLHVSYFPFDSFNHNLSIEEQIKIEQMLF